VREEATPEELRRIPEEKEYCILQLNRAFYGLKIFKNAIVTNDEKGSITEIEIGRAEDGAQ
jgi:hypothetical protein